MMKIHPQHIIGHIIDLDQSIREANIIKRKRTKELEQIKLETERMKVLIEKINREYGIIR